MTINPAFCPSSGPWGAAQHKSCVAQAIHVHGLVGTTIGNNHMYLISLLYWVAKYRALQQPHQGYYTSLTYSVCLLCASSRRHSLPQHLTDAPAFSKGGRREIWDPQSLSRSGFQGISSLGPRGAVIRRISTLCLSFPFAHLISPVAVTNYGQGVAVRAATLLPRSHNRRYSVDYTV